MIIALVVTQAPRIWSSTGILLDQFGKMGAGEVEARLPEMAHWRGGHVPRDVECGPGSPGWDYICTFVDPFVPPGSVTPPGWKPKRMKVGVRVGSRSIKSVSQTLELDARWIMH